MDAHAAATQEPPTHVAVLAGGLATRMGASKASVRLCGAPLISYPLAAARAAGLEAVVVAKHASELPRLSERVVHEPDRPRHPLCGILAALRELDAPVIAVGCDMPFVSAELLARLARAGAGGNEGEGDEAVEAGRSCGARAAVLELEGRLQPLPARYLPAHAPALERALAEGRSLRATLEALAPRAIDADSLSPLGRPERLCFSVNDERDLRAAHAWMER
jgi:molybdopterin-guanine dinucleotide biosynthesis protein A